MSSLLEFLRTHDEAFRSRPRLASLYSDFLTHRTTNSESYTANSTTWLRALTRATRAGLIPSPPTTTSSAVTAKALGSSGRIPAGSPSAPDRLVLHTGEPLLRALQTQELGRPLALGAVVGDAVGRGELMELGAFLSAKRKFDGKAGWRVPGVWDVVGWGMRQLGFGGMDEKDGKMGNGSFVVLANVEEVGRSVVEEVGRRDTSEAARVMTVDMFAETFGPVLGESGMSGNDSVVLLTYLSRDRGEVAWLKSAGVVKFKPAWQAKASDITEEDQGIASLRALIMSIEPQIEQLQKQVFEFGKKAREAVANKNTNAAKVALRQKKMVDTKLQQRTATLFQLNGVYDKIQEAADQVEIVRIMETSTKTLKSLNKRTGGVEKVQDIMDDLREEMTTVEEIGQAINDVSTGEIDETEVEDEFEALEKAEKEKQQKAIETAEKQQTDKKVEQQAEDVRQRLAELDGLGQAIPSTADKEQQKALEQPISS